MNRRAGFTLVEVLVALVMMVLVGAAVTRILVNSLRVSQAQMVTADLQSNVRTAGLILPMELRELGYDTNIYSNAVTSDIDAIGANQIQVRASRGFSMVCGVFDVDTDPGEIRIRLPIMGIREPVATDVIQIYVENDENTGIDDQWAVLNVTNIEKGDCDGGGDPAIILTLDNPTAVGPIQNLTNANLKVGGPVRWTETMRFGRFVDADGLTYVGARSISAGEAAYSAVAGPLDPATGLQFFYYDKNGTLLVPGVANPADVRTVEVQLTGRTAGQVALAGSRRVNRAMITTTRVALRNTLKH